MPQRKRHASTRVGSSYKRAATATTLPAEPPPPVDRRDWTIPELRAELRSRRLKVGGNKPALIDRLLVADGAKPPMPEGNWHPAVVEWWNDIWSSPMHTEWVQSDVHNLYILTQLLQDFWTAKSSSGRKEAAVEFRLQRAELGLTPYSRRRLEWTIERAGEAKDDRDRKRKRDKPKPPAKPKGKDVYGALRSVK